MSLKEEGTNRNEQILSFKNKGRDWIYTATVQGTPRIVRDARS